MAGFFQESFNKKTYDVDYFVSMGSSAYSSCYSMSRESAQNYNLYQQLSSRFGELVELVAGTSESLGGMENSDNILNMYDRWTKSKSSRLLEKLKESGICPIPGTTKIAQ